MTFATSQNGIELIKSFEGCVLKAYRDAVGIWTIGYGHTSNVYPGMSITAAQAEAYLKWDLTRFENSVHSYITITITQNMHDALVSFAFNVGAGALKNSTLLGKLNQGDINGAAKEFERWVYAGEKILPGLVKRRAAEKKMFLKEANINSGEAAPPLTPSGNKIIKSFQTWLNSNYRLGLTVDGYYGTLTKIAAIKAYQMVLGVTADGLFGSNSKAAVVTLKVGNSGNAVRIMQGTLYCRGFELNKVNGIFDSETTTAVKAFQSNTGIAADGLAGQNTMYTLYQ